MFFFLLIWLLAGSPLTLDPAEIALVEPTATFQAELVSTTSIANFIRSEAVLAQIDPVLALRLVDCESGFVPKQSEVIQADGSREDSWGIWQIHLPSHPAVSRVQAMDVKWSTSWSLREIKAGRAKQWSCYHKSYPPL